MPAEGAPPEAAMTWNAERLEAELRACHALRSGHFILSSGLHSPVYVQCALLLQHPAKARAVGRTLARRLAPLRPQSVLAPAMGGLIIGHEVAAALGVPMRFTERQAGEMTLRRSFSLQAGERVVIIEDVITTGRSTRETQVVARQHGAEVVAVGSMIDRTGGDNPFEVPFFSLLAIDAESWDPASGVPMPDWGEPEKPGSRPSP
jgi:orotate phosphoribosyltransferase